MAKGGALGRFHLTPSVVGYREWDSLNVWVAGDAAFMRNWPTAYVDSQAAGSPIRNKFDIALLPGGKAGRFGTLGGGGLAVSRFSAHPREAVELVRYLTRRDVQGSGFAWIPTTHSTGTLQRPELLEPNPHSEPVPPGVPHRHRFVSFECGWQKIPGRRRGLHPGSALRADWREECTGSSRSPGEGIGSHHWFQDGAAGWRNQRTPE